MIWPFSSIVITPHTYEIPYEWLTIVTFPSQLFVICCLSLYIHSVATNVHLSTCKPYSSTQSIEALFVYLKLIQSNDSQTQGKWPATQQAIERPEHWRSNGNFLHDVSVEPSSAELLDNASKSIGYLCGYAYGRIKWSCEEKSYRIGHSCTDVLLNKKKKGKI
jgi:hypothetical protein